MSLDEQPLSGAMAAHADPPSISSVKEYLVSFGCAGDFGRFRPSVPLSCRRGDPVVVQTHRGLELGAVMCQAQPGHARHLPNTTLGRLVRLAALDDFAKRDALRVRERALLENSRRLLTDLSMPVELLDVEVLLDEEHAALLYLDFQEWDPRPFVSALSRQEQLHIILERLSGQTTDFRSNGDDEHGCGRPNCGRTTGSGCTTCGTGGGCSTCSSVMESDLKAFFAGLREQMHGRTPLL